MAELKPNDTVYIALGTNDLLDKKPSSAYAKLASMVGNRKCYWIGPPHLKPAQAKGFPKSRLAKMEANLNSFYDGLAKTVWPSCTVVDSRISTANDKTVDGVHRGPEAGKNWARKILGQ